jgi:hypothetical protein
MALEGKKHDAGKLRYELLPPDAIAAVAAVMTYGATKYGDRNWEKGMAWSRLRGAAARHLAAFDIGEDNDPETGLPHLAHATCCLMFILAFQLRGLGEDDLARAGYADTEWEALVNEAVARMRAA